MMLFADKTVHKRNSVYFIFAFSSKLDCLIDLSDPTKHITRFRIKFIIKVMILVA